MRGGLEGRGRVDRSAAGTRGGYLRAAALGAALASPACAPADESTSGGGPPTAEPIPHFDPIECPEVEGTAERLHEKAAGYDALAQRWHVPAGQDLYFAVMLRPELDEVERVVMSDNVGTWSALYAASQAFRLAVTGDPEALDNLRRIVRGEHDLMRVTGVPGLFSRVAVQPSLPGFPSAAELDAWYPDCDLRAEHCKRFIEVTEGDFAGWWFKNDVSKDEYAAHMFAMAVVWELVDDPEVRDHARDIVLQVADHLIANDLTIRDVDGAITTYGRLNALGMDDFPGFNALLALSWLRLAASVGGGTYAQFYSECLLQLHGERVCLPQEYPQPYADHLDAMGLDLDCLTNWNNHNMAQLAMYALLRFEREPGLRARYRTVLRDRLWHAEPSRPMSEQRKTLYTHFYLVNRDPADTDFAEAAREATCTMKIYPAAKAAWAVDTFATYPESCLDRSDEPLTDEVIPIDERSVDNFVWINNPYKLEREPANPQLVESPEDYLLGYWLGRFYGFFSETM